MKSRRVLLFLIFVAFGLAGCNPHSASSAQTKPLANAGEVGSRLPDFAVTDLTGQPLKSADLHGNVVLIDFWATWCQPCKKEMPGYQKLLDRYGSQGLAVIGFKASMMEDTEPPLDFARKVGVRYPLVVAAPPIMDAFGGVEGLPSTFIYDRQGVLREKVIGFEYTNVIESEIKTLLGMK